MVHFPPYPVGPPVGKKAEVSTAIKDVVVLVIRVPTVNSILCTSLLTLLGFVHSSSDERLGRE